MAEITTTQAFSDGDTVTATKLNNITANAAIQTEAITNRSSETTVDQANDLLLMYDASATALKKISLSNVIKAGTASNFPVTGNATIGGTLGVTGVLSAASTLELGHASDTTLSRGSAGRLQVEGVDVVTATSTDTLTNKTLTSGTISGGTINNASVGATTPSTGAFTTLSATGDVSIADSIVHSGDNSKIRFPADDTVTIETAGSERVRVDSSGRVGIGTASPESVYRVTVTGNETDQVGGLALISGTGNKTYVGAVSYASADFEIFNTANGYIRLATNSTERLRIDSSGNVGIGTTSPSFNLDIRGASASAQIKSTTATNNSILKIENNNTSYIGNEASSGNNTFLGTTAYATCLGNTGAYPVQLATNNNVRMTIDSSGRVGIGTSSPASLLELALARTDTSGSGALTLNGTQKYSFRCTSSSPTNGLAIDSFNGSSWSTPFVIDNAGNVGIATTSPATPLHVNGTIRYTNRPAAGTITAIGYDANGDLKNSSSSIRYKHDINDYTKGLSTVMGLRPVSFKFNGETRENSGFIAEEVDALGLSEVMLYDEAGNPDGVLYSNMVALLTKAIQELKSENDILKTRIAALEAA